MSTKIKAINTDIVEGNKLIQDFDIGKSDLKIEYHDSFHLMMPVVKKINDICINYGYIDGMDLFQLRVIAVNEKMLFDAIVQFIKWYNQTKQS